MMYLGWQLKGYYGVQSGFTPITSFKSLMAEARICPHFIEEGKRLGTQKSSDFHKDAPLRVTKQGRPGI